MRRPVGFSCGLKTSRDRQVFTNNDSCVKRDRPSDRSSARSSGAEDSHSPSSSPSRAGWTLVEVARLHQGAVLAQVLRCFEIEEPDGITVAQHFHTVRSTNAVDTNAPACHINEPHAYALIFCLDTHYFSPDVERHGPRIPAAVRPVPSIYSSAAPIRASAWKQSSTFRIPDKILRAE